MIYSGGGCALNTSRVFNWLADDNEGCVFLGCVGDDDKAEMLQSILSKESVATSLHVVSDHPTGHCIALVQADDRTLVANIGAARK